MDTKKVIYIIGTGHSGSTLLDVILGAHAQGIAVGELFSISRWFQHGAKIGCSCGQSLDNCEFWADVFDSWENKVTERGVSEYAKLQGYFEQASPLSLFSRLFHRKRFYGSSKAFKFFQLSAELLGSLLEVGGGTFIIDSSKNLAKALAMSKDPHIDLYLIHLVRDPRAVANSYYKFKQKTTDQVNNGNKLIYLLRIAMVWIIYNLLCEKMLVHVEKGRNIQISYEDLVREPQNILDRIGKIIKEDYSPVVKLIKSKEGLKVGHVVGGNQKLRTRQIVMVMDDKWKKELKRLKKMI